MNKDVKTRPAVRQPQGECDPGSELTCSYLRRTFLDPPEEMPMSSNRKTIRTDMRIVPLGSGGTILDLDWFLNYRYTKLAIQPSEITGKDDLLNNN